MYADGSVGKEQSVRDLPVRETRGGHLCDLALLRGKGRAHWFRPFVSSFPRCAQLRPRLVGPRVNSDGLERIARSSKVGSALSDPSLAAEPCAIGHLQPSVVKRPVGVTYSSAGRRVGVSAPDPYDFDRRCFLPALTPWVRSYSVCLL